MIKTVSLDCDPQHLGILLKYFILEPFCSVKSLSTCINFVASIGLQGLKMTKPLNILINVKATFVPNLNGRPYRGLKFDLHSHQLLNVL